MKKIKFTTIFLYFLCITILLSQTAFSSQNKTDPITRQYHQWLEQKSKAIPELKKAMKNENWRMRTHAMIAMGKTGDKTLIPLILDYLQRDPHISVRNCSVIALTELEAVSAVPYLLTLLDTQKPVPKHKTVSKKLLVESLGKLKDSRAVMPVYEYLFSKNSSIRLKAVKALISIGDKSVSHVLLKQIKKAEEHRLSRHVAEILGELPVPGAEQYLIQLFSDKSMINKTAATIALGKMRSEKGVPLFIQTIKTGDRKLLKNISDALVNIDSSDAVSPLCLLLKHENSVIAMAGADILSRMSLPDISGKVYEVFEAEPSANGPVAYVLGRKKYVKAAPLIKKRLSDITQTGQDEMAQALGWMNDTASVPFLVDIAQRSGKQGSGGAIWSLGRLKAGDAVPVLLKLMKKRDKVFMPRIISAMGSIRDKKFVKPLTHLYYETGHQYSLLIATTLGNIGGSEVVEFVKDNIDSDDAERRKVAGNVLTRINDRQFVPYFATLLDHESRLIRKYAVQALKRSTGLKFHTVEEWKKWLSENPVK
ncbi:MAG: HEAT repeat domain-containing protein [Desulfobacteraceae bacterium]|nr:HEAT repeat domain-containing protein [Desulfobacteraceae bacterium]